MTKITTPNEFEAALAQFIGTEQYYRHWTGHILYTDGVKFLADEAGAYWLIDAIASYQHRIGSSSHYAGLQGFQLWTLTRNKGDRAVLTCQADSNQPVLVTQEIEYTDFPLPAIKLYVEGNVLLLPSEH